MGVMGVILTTWAALWRMIGNVWGGGLAIGMAVVA